MDLHNQRAIKVRKCLDDLNSRGWVHVQAAMDMLQHTRCRLRRIEIESDPVVFTLFPKQRPWYFGVKCDKLLLSAVFLAAVEYIFDVDLEVSQDHLLVFHDSLSGYDYEVTDKWFDVWFLIISDSDDKSLGSDHTVCELSDSVAEFGELSLMGDLIHV